MYKLSTYPTFVKAEGNVALTSNGRIVIGYAVKNPEIYTLAEDGYDTIHQVFYNAIKIFPPGTIFHKMDIYVKSAYNASALPDKTYIQQKTKAHFHGQPFLNNTSFIFISSSNQGWLNASMINPLKKFVSPKDFLKALAEDENLIALAEQSADFLNSSKLFSVTPFNEAMFFHVERNYFNGLQMDRLTDVDTKANQIGESSIVIGSISKSEQLGEFSQNSMVNAEKSFGDTRFYMSPTDLLGFPINHNHIVNQIFYLTDHAKEVQQLEKLKTQFHGVRRFASAFDFQAKRIAEVLDNINANERIRLMGFHFNVIAFPEKEKERECTNEIATAFRNMDVAPYFPSGNNKTNIFVNSYPAFTNTLNAGNIVRPIDLQQALCYLQTATNYSCDGQGVLFNDRLYTLPIYRDIWDEEKKRVKARNFFILAPTGEGKSVLANHILRQYYEDDVRVVIIDLGDSYHKLSLLYPEDTAYIKYQEGSSLGINPFFVSDHLKVSATKISELTNFIFILWKREQQPTDQEIVSLNKIIGLYYEQVNEGHSFPQFYSFIQQNKTRLYSALELSSSFFDIDDFLHTCSEFVGEGMYSFLFENTEDSSYQIEGKKFVVFELDEVKDNSLLLTIMLHLISDAIHKVVWKDRSTRGVVFFDEFAKMLKFPNVLSSAEYFFQAARKQGAAIGIVLQSPSQLPENDTANAIIDNTPILFVLNNQNGYREVVKRFNLSVHETALLNSISNNFHGRTKYSEVFMKIGNYSNVVRLSLPEEVLLAYESEGKAYTEMMKLYGKTKDMYKAIELYKTQKNR